MKQYYGKLRFEQVAESNALEGSTLSVGETELAILKGVTITGHDPAYVRDALALDQALRRLVELAESTGRTTDLDQLKELHALILGERSGAGLFRQDPVRTSGSRHQPPATWKEVMAGMEQWEEWSLSRAQLPGPVRAVVLHAWLSHIHPFSDGNGRTARAITNLELVRSGYPPLIIKKKDRPRYLDALGESDEAGDLSSFFELLLEKMAAALTGLELSARREEGYDPALLRLRQAQQNRLDIWTTSLKLLALSLTERLNGMLSTLGSAQVTVFPESLDLEDYIALCDGRNVSRSWAFHLEVDIPGVPRREFLAWQGYRTGSVNRFANRTGGVSLFWSVPNPLGFPRWISDESRSPGYVELSLQPENTTSWICRDRRGAIRPVYSVTLVAELARAILEEIIPSGIETLRSPGEPSGTG
ncbi:MAG: Fic family protein [Magnetococcales bacterium]|nr:Fic family protein [Magnetococcales bacterium]